MTLIYRNSRSIPRADQAPSVPCSRIPCRSQDTRCRLSTLAKDRRFSRGRLSRHARHEKSGWDYMEGIRYQNEVRAVLKCTKISGGSTTELSVTDVWAVSPPLIMGYVGIGLNERLRRHLCGCRRRLGRLEGLTLT